MKEKPRARLPLHKGVKYIYSQLLIKAFRYIKTTRASPPFDEIILESKGILLETDERLKSQGLPIAPPVREYLAGLTKKSTPI